MCIDIVWAYQLYTARIHKLWLTVGPQILHFLSSAQQSTLFSVIIISTDSINFDNCCLSVPTFIIYDLKIFSE
jgi:hypothetical protein